MNQTSSLDSHLTLLKTTSTRFPLRPAFRIPHVVQGKVEGWNTITYQQFHYDVDHMAVNWLGTLTSAGIAPRSVIGLWLDGWTYSDVLQVYGVFRAGYVPQLFSKSFVNTDIIFELLQKSGARAFIYEPAFDINLDKVAIPRYPTANINSLPALGHDSLPPLNTTPDGDDFALILHTTGSTSGRPKLVPYTYKWLDNQAYKAGQLASPINPNKLDVFAWMDSVCCNGQVRSLLGTIQHGACVIQSTKVEFTSEELIDMIERCDLNRLCQFPMFLAEHLRNSQSNPKLLRLLQSLDEIRYSGMSLGREEANWASKNGISLQTHLASTECGPVMARVGSKGNNATLLRPLEGVSYAFVPIHSTQSNPESSATGVVSELVVLSDSADCPHPSLRSVTDGHFHTRDLFEQVSPGRYVFRGRSDDWINCDASLCDTKSIEENLRSVCSDLISECVVVGNERPSPALFVEPVRDDMTPDQVKVEILERTKGFNQRLYSHERIDTEDKIIVVDRGTLPRTRKGNIQRKMVEQTFKRKLDEVYSTDFA